MFRVLVALLILAPSVSFGGTEEPHLHFGCHIYDARPDSKTGKRPTPKLLRKFPGELCLFQKDGSVVMSFPQRVAKFNSEMREVWSYPTRAHHQINSSLDGREILIIGSELAEVGDKKSGKARGDLLLILDQDGKLKRSFSLVQNRAQFRESAWRDAVKRRFPMIWDVARFHDAKWEVTHVNTFYEIPDNAAAKSNPAFRAGGYVINDISLMLTFVLDRDLGKVLWQKHMRRESWHMTHDTQILASGHMLFYDNGTPERPYSQLVEHDLVKERDTWTYPKKFDKAFYAKRWGGLQILSSGSILFTDITTRPRIVEIDRQGREKWSWTLAENTYLQQARFEDLSQFLANNRGI